MAGKGRVVYYSTEETLRAVLEGQSDESELEVSDSSDVESDHLSDPSDHSDTESAPTLPNDENARNQVDVPPEPQNEPRRGRGRGRGVGRNRGQARGRGQPVQAAGGEEDIAQDVLIAKNGTVWQTTPPNRGRRRIQDIIRTPPGITHAAKCNSIEEAFGFFITPAMADLIALETNREARRKVRQWNDDNPENRREWNEVDSTEIKAFIGLCLYAGLHKSNHEAVSLLWSENEGRPIFTATMSRNRFTSILKFLRFDNRATRQERQADDKLAPFRDLWSLFQVQLPKFYIPGPDLCVDEQLVAFRGRCGFRQYIPSKPAKYGIKIWWCCDSQTCYPLNGEVYLGRQPGQQREVGQGARVVKQLVAPWRRSGRNVTADNFFTSIPLAEDLLKDGLTYVGTIRSNKPHIPDAMKANSTRQVNSSLFGFNDQATLVSYVPKEKQAVLALSTMHHDDQVDGDAQKPEIILYYNSTKSGVDNLDHLATMYTCRRKVNRWPVALFANVVDVGAVAAFIIWMGNFPQWKISEGKRRRRPFLSELANQLVMPHIRRRALTPTLQAPIRNAMKMVGVDLPPPVQQAQALTSAGKRKRCHLCPRGIDKKVRLACDRCKQPVCPSHSVQQVLCDNCF